LTSLAGVGAKTIEKIEAAGINSVEKLAGMTPEQLMEIPGIGEKMVDKIYQAVNRFYEGGAEAAAATGEATASGETPAEEGEAPVEAATAETAENSETANAVEEAPAAAETAAESAPASSDGDAEKAEEAKS
jgi:transcription termination/antitermination protein NusA